MGFVAFGVGAAAVHTLAKQGPGVLINLGLLLLFYLALVLIIVFVLGAVVWLISLSDVGVAVILGAERI